MQKRLKIADTVFENSKESIIVTDEMGNIISVNKACCATSGFSESELLQLNIRAFSLPKYEQSFYDNIEISLKEKRMPGWKFMLLNMQGKASPSMYIPLQI